MELQDELLQYERRLWTDGPEAYLEQVSPECLVAFPGMTGVVTRETIASSVADGPRWNDPDITLEGLLRPSPDVAILTYRAHATRQGHDPYTAIVSSGYARTGGEWKLVFHQQTPSN